MLKITRKEYKTNLIMRELNAINVLRDNHEILDCTKLNMMSVLSYLIKHGAATQTGFRKSIKDIWNMYKRYHKNVKSISNFKKIIYKLEDINLIFIERVGKINTYHARKFLEDKQEVTRGVTHGVTQEKFHESAGITNFDNTSENTEILNYKNNYINITNNTSKDVSQDSYKKSLAYKKACEENNKDTVAPVQLMVIALELLKNMNRRSEKLKSMIRSKLMNKMHIVRVNADKYVETVVLDCIAKYEFNREMYAYTIAKNKNNYRFVYNKTKKSSNFANFTQRQYDYDKLELQLLGWDTSDDN